MLVTVTILAAFVAYHVNWIRERHRLLSDANRAKLAKRIPTSVFSSEAMRAPGLLWLFGESGWSVVTVVLDGPSDNELTEADLRRVATARHLFPEAEIDGIHFDPDDVPGRRLWGGLLPQAKSMRPPERTD